MPPSTSSIQPQNFAQELDGRPMLELVCVQQRFSCREGDIIGREGTVAAPVLASAKAMSRQHLLVSWKNDGPGRTPGSWSIKLAPNVRNITMLDDRPMEHGLAYVLTPGEHRLGIVDFVCGLHVTPAQNEPMQVNTPRPAEFDSSTNLGRSHRLFGDNGLFQLLADHTQDLIAVIDERGNRVWNNAAYLVCLGYDPDEIRQSYSMAEVHADDLPLVKQAFDESMSTGIGKRIEYRMRHRDQRWVYLESQASVVNAAGPVERFLVLVARDITARKEAEEKALQRTRRLVERMGMLARFTQSSDLQDGDLEGCFSQVLEAATDHFGCQRGSVWLFSEDGATLVCQDLFERQTLQHSRGESWPVSACGRFLATLRVKRCLAIDSAFTDERLEELRPIYLFSHRVSSFLAARICVGSEVLGILVLERTDVIEHWSLEDQNFAASLADVLLTAIQTRQRVEAFAAMQRSQRLLAAELTEANNYVRALLPTPLSGEVGSEWRFVPCTSLAGDGFGHQWLDDRYLNAFLLDVAGHGVGAALLCTSVLNMLRARVLPNVDFRDPSAVLGALNRVFDMEKQANLFFTIWYGVYDRERREITYASAGHPAPVLLGASGGAEPLRTLLEAKGTMIGADPEAVFANSVTPVPPRAKLYLFSDGAFEVTHPDGSPWGFDHLVEQLGSSPRPGLSDLDSLLRYIQEMHGNPVLPDDFSVVRLTFH